MLLKLFLQQEQESLRGKADPWQLMLTFGGRWTVHPVGALCMPRTHLNRTPSHRTGTLRRTLWSACPSHIAKTLNTWALDRPLPLTD